MDTAFSFHFFASKTKKAADFCCLRPSEIVIVTLLYLHPCFPRPYSIAPQCFHTAANHDVYRLEYKVAHGRLSLRGEIHTVKLLFWTSNRRKKTAHPAPLSAHSRANAVYLSEAGSELLAPCAQAESISAARFRSGVDEQGLEGLGPALALVELQWRVGRVFRNQRAAPSISGGCALIDRCAEDPEGHGSAALVLPTGQ